MLTRELVGRIESGMSLLVGTVNPDGSPHAGRAWGVRVLDGSGRFRVLLDAADRVSADNAAAGRRVALTVSEVHTHLTYQFKGEPLAVEPPTDDDVEAAARWCALFLDAINQFDGYSRDHLEKWSVHDFVALEFRADEVFDQAPGPGAGRRVELA